MAEFNQTKGNSSHAEGPQTTVSTMQNSVDEMQEAMKRIQQAASAAGVSMAEAVSALKNIYTVPGNEKPVKVAFEARRFLHKRPQLKWQKQ